MKRAFAAALAVAALASFASSAANAPSAAATSDRCHSSAPSDFNGDGYSDLAVSAPGARDRLNTSGDVTVFHGTQTGLADSVVLHREGDFPDFGAATAVGDFNGDGCADLAVLDNSGDSGNIDEGAAAKVGYGSAEIRYGRPAPATRSPFGRSQAIAAHQINAISSACNDPDDGCPVDLLPIAAAADVNGDGYADLLVATDVQIADQPPIAGLTVIPGSKNGLQPSRASVLELGSSAFPGTDTQDSITSISVGDINGDGFADVAVTVTGAEAGRPGVDVLYGSRHGLDNGRAPQLWNRATAGVPGVDQPEGSTVATLGDFRGDGHDDLAFAEAGSPTVTVLYASSSGLTAAGAQTWSKRSPGIKGSPTTDSDRWGSTLVAGRFGTAKYDDLVVGDTRTNQISVLKGSSADGLVSADNVLWQPGQGGIPGKHLGGNAFSHAMAVGEFGRGPGEDLAVGADNANGTRGTVAVLFGTTTKAIGLTRKHAEPLLKPSKSGTRATPGDRFGAVLQNS